MPLRQKTPGEGGQPRRVHYVHVVTHSSQTWDAYIAGPCHWYECHCKGRTKPCLKWMTDGEITCDRCSPLNPPEDIGYQPLYRQIDGKPCFVVLHDYMRDACDKLKLHQRVKVGRGAEQSDGVWIAQALDPRPLYETSRADFRRPADLTESLLRVWGLPELIDWYQRTQQPSDTALTLPPGVAVRDDGKPYSPALQGAAKRWGADVVTDGPPAELYDAAVDRLKAHAAAAAKPSTNGKPKPR